MEAIECIKTRRSIRSFTDDAVDHFVVNEIIDAARFAPSWKNTQIARYVILEGDKKALVADTAFKSFEGNATMVSKAPMLVVLTYIKERSGYERDGSYTTKKEDRWQNFDCGIAAEAFCLAAHDKGLGSVILGIFDEDAIAKAINLPAEQGVAALIVLGHPAVDPVAPKRKEVSELVTFLS